MSPRRILAIAAALLPACGRACAREAPSEVTPVGKESLAIGSSDAGSDAAAPRTKAAIPASFLGNYAVVEGGADPGQPRTLELVTVTKDGAAPPAKLYTAPVDPIAQVVFSPLGNELAFTTTHAALGPTQEQAIFAMGIHGASARPLAKCGYQCVLAGIGADGELWYIDIASSSLIGDVAHVPLAGGPSAKWPHTFTACALSAVVSVDGTSMLLGVDNSLGWPECVDGGFQGFYVVPITDKARRNVKPKRTACFTTHAAKDINIQIPYLAFEGTDRIAFTVSDGWDDDAGVDPMAPWSCKRDGTDPRRTKQLPPFVDRRTLDGKDWLVIATGPEGTADEPIRILGPLDAIGAFAFHRVD